MKPARVTVEERLEFTGEYAYLDESRPRVRSDCADGIRPCPFVGCRYNLFLDVQATGRIKVTFPDLEPCDIPATCALDLAETGNMTLEEIGSVLNITRERVRQIEAKILAVLREHDLFDSLE